MYDTGGNIAVKKHHHSLISQTVPCMPECESKDYSTISRGTGKDKNGKFEVSV